MRLTHERLLDVLDYNKATGSFFWKKRISIRIKIGNSAGAIRRDGRRIITIDGETFYAYRLAWFYVTGLMPVDTLDHINGNSSDDRIENIRPATIAENNQNIRRPRQANRAGYLGVHWSKKYQTYVSQIMANGKRTHIGHFKTAEDAHQAYLEAKRKQHEFCTI